MNYAPGELSACLIWIQVVWDHFFGGAVTIIAVHGILLPLQVGPSRSGDQSCRALTVARCSTEKSIQQS